MQDSEKSVENTHVLQEETAQQTEAADIISAVRNYLLQCPVFEKQRISVDGMITSEGAFNIGTLPVDEQVRAYIGGGALRQFVFEISKSEKTADTDKQNASNAAVFEQLSAYLKQQTKLKNLPKIPSGNTAHKIETTSCGYLEKQELDMRIYIIQCRMLYTQKGER